MKKSLRCLEWEKYNLNKYKRFEELETAMNAYIHFYNHERYKHV
ncbi:IS3 family transposase [Bacillus sp. A116_S68]|nr:IS3 family transposase [Bacillus sp. A116_S68]